MSGSTVTMYKYAYITKQQEKRTRFMCYVIQVQRLVKSLKTWCKFSYIAVS